MQPRLPTIAMFNLRVIHRSARNVIFFISEAMLRHSFFRDSWLHHHAESRRQINYCYAALIIATLHLQSRCLLRHLLEERGIVLVKLLLRANIPSRVKVQSDRQPRSLKTKRQHSILNSLICFHPTICHMWYKRQTPEERESSPMYYLNQISATNRNRA